MYCIRFSYVTYRLARLGIEVESMVTFYAIDAVEIINFADVGVEHSFLQGE